MKIGSLSSTFSSRSLFGQYAREIDGAKRGIEKRFSSDSDAARVSIEGLRSKLLSVADKVSRFKDLDASLTRGLSISSPRNEVTYTQLPGSSGSSGGSGSGAGGAGGGSGEAGGISFSISTEGSSRQLKFDKELAKAFEQGFGDGSDRLLKNPNLSGEVRFEINNGGQVSSFSIAVDGNTTAQDFVNAINQQSGGLIDARLANSSNSSGEARFRIALSAGQPAPISDPESPDGGAGEASGPTQEVVSSAPEVLLGQGSVNSGRSREQAAYIERELKDFVRAFNELASYAEKDSKSGALGATQVDEALMAELKSAFSDAKSSDGRLSIESFVTTRADGQLAVDTNSLQAAFLEDPEAVVSVFKQLAAEVSGASGIARDYSSSEGKFEQALGAVQFKIANQATQELNNLQAAVESPRSGGSLDKEELARPVTSSISKVA